ncbi:hypothetical protein NMY22_g18694 [Coprinellus aureogranulatus]|nr:hypothetical protein NMY22_g18694 [Coprinellus aureogranulatus]
MVVGRKRRVHEPAFQRKPDSPTPIPPNSNHQSSRSSAPTTTTGYTLSSPALSDAYRSTGVNVAHENALIPVISGLEWAGFRSPELYYYHPIQRHPPVLPTTDCLKTPLPAFRMLSQWD